MTREEAIEMLNYIKRIGNGEGPYKNDAQSIALDMAISALSADKWIPVSKELPKNSENELKPTRVLYCTKTGVISDCMYWNGFNRSAGDDGEFEFEDVVAWMPLPEPYNAESKDPNDLTHIFDGVTEIPKDAFKGWYTDELLEKIRAESEDKE